MSIRLRIIRERAETIRNWRSHAQKIAGAATEVLGEETEVYAFGSAVRGEATPSSDVDLLIVVNGTIPSLKVRNRMMMMVEEAAGLGDFHPFEIHVVGSEEAAPYFRHAGRDMIALGRRRPAGNVRRRTIA